MHGGRYTYVFDGVSQVLDHILVAPGVGAVEYQVVHVNAEYATRRPTTTRRWCG